MSARSKLVKVPEWEGEKVRVVRLEGLPTGSGRYRTRRRPIQHVIVHQSAGNPLRGIDAPYRIARFHTAPPRYKTGPDGKPVYRRVRGKMRKWWIGGGRGWPAIAYHFVVPAVPDIVDGKFEVYRCLDDDVHSYHTGPGFNSTGVGVVVAGNYQSRHAPKHGGDERPDPTAVTGLSELVLDYLLPRYVLNDDREESLLGHFDAGKPTCPGDWLEQWVRFQRGEDVENPEGWDMEDTEPLDVQDVVEDDRPLETTAEQQSALAELGFDVFVDGVFGPFTRAAIAAFQAMVGLDPTGIWDDATVKRLRRALADKASGRWD